MSDCQSWICCRGLEGVDGVLVRADVCVWVWVGVCDQTRGECEMVRWGVRVDGLN